MSAKYKDKKSLKFTVLVNSISIFPGLNHYELKEGKLKKVDGFEAKEISGKIGKILFNNDNSEEDSQIIS